MLRGSAFKKSGERSHDRVQLYCLCGFVALTVVRTLRHPCQRSLSFEGRAVKVRFNGMHRFMQPRSMTAPQRTKTVYMYI